MVWLDVLEMMRKTSRDAKETHNIVFPVKKSHKHLICSTKSIEEMKCL